jgi:hypothetical protein
MKNSLVSACGVLIFRPAIDPDSFWMRWRECKPRAYTYTNANANTARARPHAYACCPWDIRVFKQ